MSKVLMILPAPAIVGQGQECRNVRRQWGIVMTFPPPTQLVGWFLSAILNKMVNGKIHLPVDQIFLVMLEYR